MVKIVPFEFEFIRYAFEATIPTHWYLVTEKEFDAAMSEMNWNRSWYLNCCIYKQYNKTIGVHDDRIHKWYLNPDYFSDNLNPKLVDDYSVTPLI